MKIRILKYETAVFPYHELSKLQKYNESKKKWEDEEL